MEEIVKMDGTSLTPQHEKLNALRQVLPEAFSEGKIDWEKLKATLGEDINFSNERYVLNWAGKSDAFKVLQMPSTKTLIPVKEESVNFDETENIFIEGENLEVLKVLQKSYFGRVKMIYIDPPYNTGNDSFIYPDKFSESKADYEKRVGDKDEEGYMTKDGMFKKNSKENGQYHSNWLNMMMPRLYLAKNLLRQDGVIFVSIDDNEVHNLRLLMNEVFGEENRLDRGSLVWINKGSTKGFNKIVKNHEYILAYGKNEDSVVSYYGVNFSKDLDELEHYCFNKPNPGNPICQILFKKGCPIEGVENSIFTDHVGFEVKLEIVNGKMEFKDGFLKEDVILKGAFPYRNQIEEFFKNFGTDKETYDYKGQKWKQIYFNSKGMPRYRKERNIKIISSVIDDSNIPNYGSNDIKCLFEKKDFFSFPKPKELIFHILSYFTTNTDIVFDFFAGSGTTAHAVMDLNKEDGGNRKYICVQLPELCDEKSEPYKAGYKTIAEISKERIRRAGKKISEEINSEIKKIESEIKKLQGEIPADETKTEIENLKTKIEQLQHQDLGFKVLKLEDSNFKQWQQIEGKDAKALAEQMKLFVDPISENATIENMVYELLLKSGKDLNSKICYVSAGSTYAHGFFKINGTELILLLEKATQENIDSVIAEKPIKVIALDKLFKGNDQLKTNTVLQMKDAGIEFKTI
jgi:adenine-specific DNA-methyltransferase